MSEANDPGDTDLLDLEAAGRLLWPAESNLNGEAVRLKLGECLEHLDVEASEDFLNALQGILGTALPAAGTLLGSVWGGPLGGALGGLVGSQVGTIVDPQPGKPSGPGVGSPPASQLLRAVQDPNFIAALLRQILAAVSSSGVSNASRESSTADSVDRPPDVSSKSGGGRIRDHFSGEHREAGPTGEIGETDSNTDSPGSRRSLSVLRPSSRATFLSMLTA